MKTVYNSLTFYDSLDKVDVNRTHAVIPAHCPRHQLPPFIISLDTDTTGTVDTIELVGTSTVDITSYFPALPSVYTDASLGDYIEYKGTALNTLLPIGLWYVKLSADGYVYYSDYIMVDDIYPNLISLWVNGANPDGYTTFTVVKTAIQSAITAAGPGHVIYAGAAIGGSLKKGEKVNVIGFVTSNSGDLPSFEIHATAGGALISDTKATTAGLNNLELTITQSSDLAYLKIFTTGAANYSMTEILLVRKYCPNHCKIKFTNTNNVGNLLYADDFYQEAWLESILNNPSHELVTVGEEKDGIFIPEKMVSKYIYSIIAYVSRAMYSCLMRLPQHDSITITDETGESYTPDQGNIIVEQPEWIYYDTAKVTIRFNNGSDSQYVWTK